MMKFVATAAVLAVLAWPVAAQQGDTEIREGVRYLVPKDRESWSDQVILIETRAIEMGFFDWPLPTEKAVAEQVNRPRKVDDCDGHDPEYRAPHDFSSKDDPRMRHIGQAKAFIYEWMAFVNAIEAEDCTCATLRADWSEAVASFQALTQGIEKHALYTAAPNRMRSGIKRDYNQMCDVRMLLDLE